LGEAMKFPSLSLNESQDLLFRKVFHFSVKKCSIALALFFVSVVAHNIISGLLKVEEPVFFLIAVIGVPLYLLISIVYSLLSKFVLRGS
jgi:hypothetical protein